MQKKNRFYEEVIKILKKKAYNKSSYINKTYNQALKTITIKKFKYSINKSCETEQKIASNYL